MEETPLVSIGLPTYNRADLLDRALKSLISQDYPNLELIVLDNASTDHTETVCSKYVGSCSFVCCHRNATNVKAFGNFEQVLKLARGEYFMWAADDDLWESDYVSTLVSVLQADPSLMLAAAETQYMLPDMTKLPFFPGAPCYYGGQNETSQLQRLLQIVRRTQRFGNLIYGIFRRDGLMLGDETVLSRVNYISEIPLFIWIGAQGSIRVHPRVLMYKSMSLSLYMKVVWEYGFNPLLGYTVERSEGSKIHRPAAGTQKRRLGIVGLSGVGKLLRLVAAWLSNSASTYAYGRRALVDILRTIWRIQASSYVKLVVSLVVVYMINIDALRVAYWKTARDMRAR